MLGNETSNDFPPFHGFCPSDVGFTCIYLTKALKRCANIVSKNDKAAASALRETILSALSISDEHVESLQQYAELCCCKRTHRPYAIETEQVHRIVQQWKDELDCHESTSSKSTGNKDKIPAHQQTGLVAQDEAKQPTSSTSFDDSSHSLASKVDVAGTIQDQITTAEDATGLTTRPVSNIVKPARFIAYKSGSRETLEYTVSADLRPAQFANGTLYMFRRDSDPGFVKLGYTTWVADDRFSWIERECAYVPIPIRQIRNVPYIQRIERLVHIELAQYRKKSMTCLDVPTCRTRHAEWFQVDETTAMGVMDRWTRWAIEAEPYGADGCLTREWMNVCGRLVADGVGAISKSLLLEMDALQREKPSREAESRRVLKARNANSRMRPLVTKKLLDVKPFTRQTEVDEVAVENAQ